MANVSEGKTLGNPLILGDSSLDRNSETEFPSTSPGPLFSVCRLCGRGGLPLGGSRGRSPEYHPECKQIQKALSVLENHLDELRLSSSALISIRSRLFSLANALPLPRDSRGRFLPGRGRVGASPFGGSAETAPDPLRAHSSTARMFQFETKHAQASR